MTLVLIALSTTSVTRGGSQGQTPPDILREELHLLLTRPDGVLAVVGGEIQVELAEIGPMGNARGEQGNQSAQLQGEAKARAKADDDLMSHVDDLMTDSPAWILKVWIALVLPEQDRWTEKYRAEERSSARTSWR